MRRSRAKRTLLTVLALVLALVWAFPVYWMLNSAFLPNVVLQSARPRRSCRSAGRSTTSRPSPATPRSAAR